MERKATPDILGSVLAADPEVAERSEVRRKLTWDYDQVSPLHRRTVEDAAVEILISGRRMQQSVMVIGQRLNEVKGLLDHGQFTDWCEREFGMNVRTAQRMMSVATNLEGKSDKLSHLGTSVLYLIGADSTPEPVREAVMAQAATVGKSPTVAEVKQSIRLYVANLRGIVRLWAEQHWLRSREIPANAAHTNGEFWRQLTAWMHANVTDTWTEADLKAAIRQEYRLESLAQFRQEVQQRLHGRSPEPAGRTVYTESPATSAESATVLPAVDERPLPEWSAPTPASHYESGLPALEMPLPADDRIGRARRLIETYRATIRTFDDYGNLIGAWTETMAAQRELEKLIRHLEREISLLQGKVVEEEWA